MIKVRDLKKHFKTFKKDAGLFESVKSVIRRQHIIVKALDSRLKTLGKLQEAGIQV